MQHLENNIVKSRQNNVLPFIPEGDFYFTKGVEAFRKRKFDIALKWLKKAIEQKPNDPLYKCQMSIIYTEIGSYHAANQLLTNVLQSTGDQYMDCYYLLANNYAHLGLLNDAKKYAESYLTIEPEGDFSEEAKSLLHLIDIDEEDEDDWDLEEEDELLIYQETVFYHMENNEWDKAMPIIEEMLTLFPEHKQAKHDYAQALFYTGFREKAIQLELDILQDEPDSLVSHSNLAVFYCELDQKVECEKHIQSLQNVYPIQEQQKLRIAVTLARTGMYREAVMRFRTLVKRVVKNHPSYYRWFSIASYHEGDQAKAMSLWKEGCRQHSVLANEKEPWL
ncbi:tetratricopeptide repeat protein [Virgibacillus sp. FSP13]